MRIVEWMNQPIAWLNAWILVLIWWTGVSTGAMAAWVAHDRMKK